MAGATSEAGSNEIDDCTCKPGFSGPESGSLSVSFSRGGTCTACPAGKHKETAGPADCTDCEAGKYADDDRTGCDLCNAGKWTIQILASKPFTSKVTTKSTSLCMMVVRLISKEALDLGQCLNSPCLQRLGTTALPGRRRLQAWRARWRFIAMEALRTSRRVLKAS